MDMFGITECKGYYFVRLGYKKRKPTIQRCFYWGTIRTKDKALTVAIDFRDTELKKLKGKGFYESQNYRETIQRNNKSGINGICRSRVYTKTGKPTPDFCWQTTYTDKNGTVKNKKFSIKIHGEAMAKKLACLWRSQGLGIMIEKLTISGVN